MTFKDKMLSFEGRMRRQDFWLCTLANWGILFVALIILAIPTAMIRALAGFDGPVGPQDISPVGVIALLINGLVNLAVLVMFFWAAIAIQAKRAHDRNQTAWVILLNIVPFFNLINLGMIDGTHGSNRYGPSPKGIGSTPEADHFS